MQQFEDVCVTAGDEQETTVYDETSDEALIHSLYDEILVKIFVLLDLRDRIRIERGKNCQISQRKLSFALGDICYTSI